MKLTLLFILLFPFVCFSQIQDFYGVPFNSSYKEVVQKMKEKGHKKFSKTIHGDLIYNNVVFADFPSEMLFEFKNGNFVSGSSSVYGLGDKYKSYYNGLAESLESKYGEYFKYKGGIDAIPSSVYKKEDVIVDILYNNDNSEHVYFWQVGNVRISLSYNYGRRVKLTYTLLENKGLSIDYQVKNPENL